MKPPNLIDQTSPAALAAQLVLRHYGVATWVHDRVYGLVADPDAPHGFRLVASAPSFPDLAREITRLEARGRTILLQRGTTHSK